MSFRVALGLVLALAAITPLLAAKGTVVDPQGQLLEGVTACYVVADVEQLCVTTDEGGRYQLPTSRIDTVRLAFDGYLPQKVSSADYGEAIVMQFAAILAIKFVDAAGRPIENGEFDLLYSSGKRIGAFPIAAAAGTRVRSLEPGPVVVIGRSEGFADTRAPDTELRGGEETLVIVRLERAPK